MISRSKKFLSTAILVFIGVFIASFFMNNTGQRDYKEILESKVIRITTSYNSNDYFVHGDTIAGFQYDLAHEILKEKGLHIEITPIASLNEQVEKVNAQIYDIAASNIIGTKEIKEAINLTIPILTNRQVLVQRTDSTRIDNQLNLAKKTIYVVKNSPAILRINNLSNEIADTIFIEEFDKYGQEALIAMVAHGDIDYAVCDEIVAKAESKGLNNVDTSLAIGFTQFYSWGVSKEAPVLLDSLNHWIAKFMKTEKYQELYTKYYH